MKPITAEWVAKAEGDLTTARRELAASESPNYDAACFHAQQCAEKYLKGLLVEAGATFPKTHDLSALLDLVLPIEPGLSELRGALDRLTDLGVEVRYPGVSAGEADATEAVRAAERVRGVIRSGMGLDTRPSGHEPTPDRA